MIDQSPRPLSNKQQLFVEFYLQTWNASLAARKAGYNNAHVVGPRMTKHNPLVQAAIQERIQAAAMGTDEVLARLAEQARVSIADFLLFDQNGAYLGIDWPAVRDYGHLVKSIVPTKWGIKIELVDGQAALFKLGLHHRLFTEQVDVTSNGEPIVVKLVGSDD